TEGASQSLLGKPGVHQDIRAVQTLSLRQLLDAMREVKRLGRPGDTVILDSISKVLLAMRAYAQQRAGAEVDRKTSIAYDEYASVNRNMQVIYTVLTELKQAGFHVLIIGHLAKKYQSSGNALTDVGLRVLADESITYEADAILLVERNGQRRSITPIIKPPRQGHLQINQEYPATLATLYPDQVPVDKQPDPENAPSNVMAFPAEEVRNGPPRTPEEAERRFFARYSEIVGGGTWPAVQKYLGYRSPKPVTIDEWIEVGAEVRQHGVEAAEGSAA
ncbi:MAG: ATP-binding protein, partial [Chloroflexi bacterium]|nr:ATP-binding protein [Chloroflexota bacterium]